jgi:hypothetical protein
MINWKRKLSSRKFWALAAAFITAVLVLFNASEADIVKITAIITAGGSAITYILAEGSIDAKKIEK